MEFASGGELFELIVQNQRLKEKTASKHFQELVAGVHYIHKLGICHRDLKPENLLIDFDGSLKIVDFGLSNMYEPGQTLKTACGSPCYAAPEVSFIRFNSKIDDCWKSLPRNNLRHLVDWRCSFCNAMRILALWRLENLKSLQKNSVCWLLASKVFILWGQRYNLEDLCNRSCKSYWHRRTTQTSILLALLTGMQ